MCLSQIRYQWCFSLHGKCLFRSITPRELVVTFSKSPKSPSSTFHNERGAEALAEAAHRPGAISVQSMQQLQPGIRSCSRVPSLGHTGLLKRNAHRAFRMSPTSSAFVQDPYGNYSNCSLGTVILGWHCIISFFK